MDNAVALVQAYLHLNGYFTVAEYPVLEALKHGGYRTVTDLDILAFRFAAANRPLPSANEMESAIKAEAFVPDPALGIVAGETDMLLAEVKEGSAQLNIGATDPITLRAALVRFGCCGTTDVEQVSRTLLRRGHLTLPSGHNLRMVAFGAVKEEVIRPYLTISLGHVLRFLQDYIRQNWEFVRHAQFKDSVFGFLVTLEKASQGAM